MPEILPEDICSLESLFEDVGLTLKKSVKTIFDAHKATRDKQPDHKIRLEAAKTALGLRGFTSQTTKTKHEFVNPLEVLLQEIDGKGTPKPGG